MGPKISVVLPTYNGEKYISESIESILNQSFRDWELIIVDDCSTDNTFQIVETYAKQDARIRVIRNTSNQKLPGALNIGFAEAAGTYLTWTSDDNRYLKDAFYVMAEYLDAHKEDSMVCTNMLFFDDSWTLIREHEGYSEEKMSLEDVVGASFLYRRSILDEVGVYDEDLFCVEDYEYWMRILECGHRIGFIPGVYYLYRTHDQSLTVAKKQLVEKQRRRMFVKHLEWILSKIAADEGKLYHLYGELIKNSEVNQVELRKRFAKENGNFSFDTEIPDGVDLFLYGGGQNCLKAIAALKGRTIQGIADKNYVNMPKMMEGMPLMSPEEMVSKLKVTNAHLVVTVGAEKQGEVISWLVEQGVTSFSVFAHLDVE